MGNSREPSPKEAKRRFYDTLRGSRNAATAFSAAREWLPPDEYVDAIKWLLGQPKMRANVFPSITSPTSANIYRFRPPSPLPPAREIRWASAYLLHFSDMLSEHARLRGLLQSALLDSDFDVATALLNQIEARTGLSFWSMKTRIAVVQASQGLEAQKEYAKRQKVLAPRPGVTAYILHHVSVRNEPSVSPARFIQQQIKQIDGYPIPVDLRAFVKYHVVNEWPQETGAAIALLRHSSAASLVDTYEYFLFLARFVAGLREEKLRRVMIAGIATLSARISDTRFAAVLFALDESSPAPQLPDLHAFRSLIEGSEVEQTGDRQWGLSESLIGYEAFETAARLQVNSTPSRQTLASETLRLMEAVLEKKPALETIVADLIRTALNFSTFEWAENIRGFVSRELSFTPVGASSSPTSRRNASYFSEGERTMAVAASETLHPLNLELLAEGPYRIRYARALGAAMIPGSVRDYASVLSGADPSNRTQLRSEELLRTRSIAALRAMDYKTSAEISSFLLGSPMPFYSQWGIRAHAFSLLQRGMLPECISFVATHFVENDQLHFLLPITDLADQLTPSIRKALGHDPSLVIVLDAYARFIDHAYDKYRRHAYEDLLSAAGVRRPSELRNRAGTFEPAKLLYYLRFVCVPEIMYMSTAYNGSRQLHEERISVLQWLSDLDPVHRSQYQEEILERTRRLVVQERRVAIEQSKIQVDLEGFKRDASRNLRESFDRYLAYRSADTRTISLESWRGAIEEARVGDSSRLIALALPDNELATLFASMILEMRDEFITSKSYGLDGFLSTRIRHGTLASELRSPLIAAHLVTPLDEATGQYRSTIHWRRRYEEFGESVLSKIDASLAALSKDFDALLHEIVAEWVQVKRSDDSKGLLDLTFTSTQLSIIEPLVTQAEDFEAFVGIVFDVLVTRIEPGLEAIRGRVDSVAKPRTVAMLARLESELDAHAPDVDIRELRHAVREAGTAVQQAFDRVASWFTLTTGASLDPMPLSDVVSIGVEVAQRLYPGLDIGTELGDAGSVPVDGGLAPSFVDIMLIVFSNVVKHSGLGDAASAQLTVKVENGDMQFTVSNLVTEEINRESAVLTINRIQDAIKAAEYLKSMHTEGRTGFHKMYKILTHDFGQTANLKFGFEGKDKFIVSFALPLNG